MLQRYKKAGIYNPRKQEKVTDKKIDLTVAYYYSRLLTSLPAPVPLYFERAGLKL